MNEILVSLLVSILIIIYIMIAVQFTNWFLCIILIALLIFIIINCKKIIIHSIKLKKKLTFNSRYVQKEFMTNYELSFYYKIMDLEEKYNIVPQINLASIIHKISDHQFQNELFRNIDFAIFTRDYSQLLLLIEINDKTHNEEKRKERDKKVKFICNSAGIKLITFYTKYPNEKQYVINRILTEIEKQYKN